jgi:hypothetical protein
METVAGKRRKTRYIFLCFLFLLISHIVPAPSRAEGYLSLYQSAVFFGNILEKGIDSLPAGCRDYQPEFVTIYDAVRDFYRDPFNEEHRKKIQDARRALIKFSNDCMPGKNRPPQPNGTPPDRSEQPPVTLNVPSKDQGEVQPLVLESRSWQSDVIYGMSDFIVDRAKQELVIVFLEEFKKKLEDNKIYRDFFQNTYALLSSYCDDGCEDADGEVEKFLTGGRSLNAALKADIHNFLDVAMEKYLKEDAKKTVQMAIAIADGVDRGLTPEWIFNRLRLDLKLDPLWLDTKPEKDFRRGLYIISSFALEYYRDINNVGTFVGTELLGKEHELFAYLLLAEAHADREFSKKLGLAPPEEKDPRFERFWSKLQRLMLILEKAKAVSDDIEFMSRAEPRETVWDPLLFKNYSLAMVDAVDFVGELINDGQAKRNLEIITKDLDKARHELDKAKKALKEAHESKKDFEEEENNLKQALHKESLTRGRYRDTVNEHIVIYLFLLPRAAAFHTAIKSEDYNRAVALTLEIMNVYLDDPEKEGEVKNFYKDLHKYLSFTYRVVTAKSSEDVKTALKDAAMPAGGFRVKAKKEWTITINSYLGVGGGVERLEETEFKTDWGYHVSPWAPIGFEARFKGGKIPWVFENFGLFLSILDLGAVASFRISERESVPSTASEIGFAQVLSPGFFYIKPLTERVPLSLALGVHFTPNLHEVRENEIETHANSLRFSLFLAIDIPLFTLY